MSKILIIDDDKENREILKIRLRKAGYEVEEATNGEEGLQKCAALIPDLVILDVMMPKIDGWQVCRQLKAAPATKDIPVVMLTSCTMPLGELRGYESGADQYLAKPWDAEQLRQVIVQCLEPRTVPGSPCSTGEKR